MLKLLIGSTILCMAISLSEGNPLLYMLMSGMGRRRPSPQPSYQYSPYQSSPYGQPRPSSPYPYNGPARPSPYSSPYSIPSASSPYAQPVAPNNYNQAPYQPNPVVNQPAINNNNQPTYIDNGPIPVVNAPVNNGAIVQTPKQPSVVNSVIAGEGCLQYVDNRVYCGNNGTDKTECESMGCCWDPLAVGTGELTCFFHSDMANFVAPSVPVKKPTNPQATYVPPSYAPPQPKNAISSSNSQSAKACLKMQCDAVAKRDRRTCLPDMGMFGNQAESVCNSAKCCYDVMTMECFHARRELPCNAPAPTRPTVPRPSNLMNKLQQMEQSMSATPTMSLLNKLQQMESQMAGSKPQGSSTLQKLQSLEAQMANKQQQPTQQPYRPTIQSQSFQPVFPKAAGLNGNPVGQPAYQPNNVPNYQPPAPTPAAPRYVRKCTLFGGCRMVAVQPPPQTANNAYPVPATVQRNRDGTCFPQNCGDPAYTPDKIDNDFDPRKIVGGSRAFPFSHPWTVMIQKNEGNRTFICGATLICQQWLMTAAHCLDQQSSYKNTPDLDPNMYKIYIGRWAGWQAPHGKQVQIFKGNDIERMFQHEKFVPGKHRGVITHDIALIKLRKQVRLDDFTQPACLPTESPVPKTVMFATGWGVHKNKGPKPTTLKQVGVEIKDKLSCKNRVPGFDNPPGVICGGGEPDHDTCTGDSGGPLVGSKQKSAFLGTSTKTLWYVYGLTSIGSPSCNTKAYDRQPALYTDVYYFLDWIKARTNNCCA